MLSGTSYGSWCAQRKLRRLELFATVILLNLMIKRALYFRVSVLTLWPRSLETRLSAQMAAKQDAMVPHASATTTASNVGVSSRQSCGQASHQE